MSSNHPGIKATLLLFAAISLLSLRVIGAPTDPVGSRQSAVGSEPQRPASQSIPLSLRCVGIAQKDAPVFAGIPFPPGALKRTEAIELQIADKSVPRQVETISRYPDGSVRVALIGFKVNLPVGGTLAGSVSYGSGRGIELNPTLSWVRNPNVLVLCSPEWYGASTVYNLPFLPSAKNDLAPAFEDRLRARYLSTSHPPASVNPDQRNYYDHLHALYMVLVRNGGPETVFRRIREELMQYRELEIIHSGVFRGHYLAGSIRRASKPMQINVIRRLYVQGLLEDFYFTGDRRSFEVARAMADALLADTANRSESYTWTERTPAWTIMGLAAFYEATLEKKYLDAAKRVAGIMIEHQLRMAALYPNQGGIKGQTGGFLQNKDGRWFDPDESTASGAGSPFMTALLLEGMIRLHWLTGDADVRRSILEACDWLVDVGYDAKRAAFHYIARDPASIDVSPGLNPMFLQSMGFAYQATGEDRYRDVGLALLKDHSWGDHIKEFNQAMRTSGQGLLLLSMPARTATLTSPGPAHRAARH